MPPFPWLGENKLDTTTTGAKIRAFQTFGVPYPPGYDATANADVATQSAKVAVNLKDAGIDCPTDREIIALIAYLQRLGTDIKKESNSVRASGGGN